MYVSTVNGFAMATCWQKERDRGAPTHVTCGPIQGVKQSSSLADGFNLTRPTSSASVIFLPHGRELSPAAREKFAGTLAGTST